MGAVGTALPHRHVGPESSAIVTPAHHELSEAVEAAAGPAGGRGLSLMDEVCSLPSAPAQALLQRPRLPAGAPSGAGGPPCHPHTPCPGGGALPQGPRPPEPGSVAAGGLPHS